MKRTFLLAVLFLFPFFPGCDCDSSGKDDGEAGSVTVTSPNGGQTWVEGETHDITWTSTGTVGNVDIAYSTDGTTWNDIATGETNDGSYSWAVPDDESTTVRVRVQEADGTPSDQSDADFTIERIPAITVTSPNGAEVWVEGETHDITWSWAGSVGDVDIAYSTDGTTWNDVATGETNDGSYSWTVPNDESTTVRVRVQEADGDPFDISDAVFTIWNGVWKVDGDAVAGGDGRTWETAFKTIQEAVGPSGAAQDGDEVWVVQSIYTNNGAGTATVLEMQEGIHIYGGFEGYGGGSGAQETERSQRDWENNVTTLDGEDTAYHVVTGANNATLDGFTITRGNAAGSDPDNSGGGMYNNSVSGLTVCNCTFSGNSAGVGGGMHNRVSSSPTVTNCTFSGNSADGGGGMFNYDSSSPTLTNCTFSGNSADWYGGGMYNRFDSSPTVTNCTFSGNSADLDGGGMHNWDNSSPALTDCTFSGNSAGNGGGMFNTGSSPAVTNCTFSGNSAYYGGGMYNNWGSSPAVTNCTFSGNSADWNGGGMSNWDMSSPVVTNCTFCGNSAKVGGGMHNGKRSSPSVTNCIFWNDTAVSSGDEMYNADSGTDGSHPTISYTDIEGGLAAIVNEPNSTVTDGGGNIDVDPLLTHTAQRCDMTTATGTTTTVEITDASTNYAVNDVIEIDNDNVARTVSAVGGTTVTFSPALPAASAQYTIVHNWDAGATDLDFDLHLQATSPCIDAADGAAAPATDIEGNPRYDDPGSPNTGVGPPWADMGAYERQ